jgi:N-acetylmuramoyl-L-alanine amidase
VRVYAPALASSPPSSPPLSSGRFLPWGEAQANSLARSQELAQTIVGELDKKSITALKLATPIRPLNNVTAPAVAVELAPDPDNMQDIMAQKFQTTVAAGIAAGIAQLRPRLEGQP